MVSKFLLVLLTVVSVNSFAQKELKTIKLTAFDSIQAQAPSFLSLLHLASEVISKNDTVGAIRVLENFAERNPQNQFLESAIYIIGNLYALINENKLAKKSFLKLLEKQRKDWHPFIIYSDKDTSILTRIDDQAFHGYKYSTCFQLFELSLKKHEYKNAEKHLSFVVKKYPPSYFFCGNAVSSHRERLNLKYVELYLITHDTLKAAEKLWSCIINQYGLMDYSDTVSIKLRQILYAKYTNKQICAEIDRGISDFKEVRYRDSKIESIRFQTTIFGVRVSTDNFYTNNIKEFKEKLLKNYSITVLKQKRYKPGFVNLFDQN